ncbi:MAG: antitoxin PHD [Bdellovibrio sp.]|nr:MAG: antitoxin PHD [Bdellovibrio sp.]
MKAVGVKSLKAKLSEYLRLVKSGETVLVTERDQVVAEIRPANRQEIMSPLEQFLDQGQESGTICLRTEDSKRFPPVEKIQWLKAPDSEGILNFLRDE